MLTKKQKLHFTSGAAFFLQIFTMIYGFVLPRLFLNFYGSAVNGLVASITQFLGLIVLAECGIGAVVQSALYKPLANKDYVSLSRIVVASEKYFRNVAMLLLLYSFVLMIIFPSLVNDQYDFFFTASLIGIIVISSFAQYFFGVTNRLLLNSDQFGFVPIIVQICALTLNLILSVVLMYSDHSVHFVKFASSIVFLMQPLIVSFIAHRWYKIERRISIEKDTIPQKWNGLAQHISYVVLRSSGVVVLSTFSSLEKVSVYSVYFLVVQGIRDLTASVTNGVQAFLGNLFAKGEFEAFKNNFEKFEWKMHFAVTTLFSITAILIVPFVCTYTKGIMDVNYREPLFGIVLTLSWGIFCIRLPYNIVVLAVGHYKQTQSSAIVEAVLNICVAVFFVLKWGLVGVALGTLIAVTYRTVYLAWYVSENVVQRSLKPFVKHVIVDIVTVTLIVFTIFCVDESLFKYDELIPQLNYISWTIKAIECSVIGFLVSISVNLIFYKKNLKLGE